MGGLGRRYRRIDSRATVVTDEPERGFAEAVSGYPETYPDVPVTNSHGYHPRTLHDHNQGS
jgi:hypothetical protein